MENSKKPFYKTWWGIILTFLFFPFIIPFIIWKYTNWSKWVKILITICCIIFFFSIIITGWEKQKQAENINSQIISLLETKSHLELNETKLFTESKTIWPSFSNPIHEIEKQYSKAIDLDVLISALWELSDEDFEKLKNNQLNTEFFTNPSVNKFFYNILQNNIESREKYKEEIKTKKEKENEAKKAEEKRQEWEKRIKELEQSFSTWDGSHINLTKFIKSNMNDAKSYEHVDTTYIDKVDHLIVTTKFRWNNAFGAKVINTITAKISIGWEIIEIISQN